MLAPLAVTAAVAGEPDVLTKQFVSVSSAYDGEYVGKLNLLSQGARGCPEAGPTKILIQNGIVALPWYPGSRFAFRVHDNGSFSGMPNTTPNQADKHMSAPPSAAVHVSDKKLTAEYGTRFCHYTLEAERA